MKNFCLIFIIGLMFSSCEKNEETPDTGIKNKHRIAEIIIVRPEIFDIRISFTYSGEKISEVVYHGSINTSALWEPFYKINYSYNGNRIIAVRSEIKTVEWRTTDKSEYLIENGNIIEESYFDYVSTEWELKNKFTYTYDGSKLTLFRSYSKDTETNNLISNYKSEYEYVNDTLRQFIRYKFYDENVSLPDDKFVFDYKGGKMESYTEFIQNLNDEWVKYLKCEYKYMASGPYEARAYSWNEEDSSWTDESVFIRFAYDQYGYMAKRISWDGLEYTYKYEDGHGNAALVFYYPEELVFGEPTLKSTGENKNLFNNIFRLHQDILNPVPKMY